MPSNIISKTNLDFEMFLKAEFFLHLPDTINPNQPDYFKKRAKNRTFKTWYSEGRLQVQTSSQDYKILW
tara:strand:+ start:5717 stop:5923 length:207 start_codon:yes stop_codon:yes gene_type:complete